LKWILGQCWHPERELTRIAQNGREASVHWTRGDVNERQISLGITLRCLLRC
jgi:hypothetical protein